MNAASTEGGLRGWKPWLDERQAQISVTRVIRDDLAKRKYECVMHLIAYIETNTSSEQR